MCCEQKERKKKKTRRQDNGIASTMEPTRLNRKMLMSPKQASGCAVGAGLVCSRLGNMIGACGIIP